MLDGRPTVFLSCSERFREKVAESIAEALEGYGLQVVIVSKAPMLPRVRWEPDSKVQSYLTASDAVVALCTPDDTLDDGTVQPRQNVIEEIRRGKDLPHLSDKVMILKAPGVTLPSNIDPTYDRLDTDRPLDSLDTIIGQLRAWGVVPEASPTPAEPPTEEPVDIESLLSGIALGEPEKASVFAYQFMLRTTRDTQRRAVDELGAYVLRKAASLDTTKSHVAGSVLEAMSRLDHTLVPLDLIEALASSRDTVARITAVSLLDDMAQAAPAEVPLGLLGRLARPGSEDWYVQAPAMALTKSLMLKRRDARLIVDGLSRSKDPEDRYAAAKAVVDVAEVDPLAVPYAVAKRLAKDSDRLVRKKAEEALTIIEPWDENAEWARWRPFGI